MQRKFQYQKQRRIAPPKKCPTKAAPHRGLRTPYQAPAPGALLFSRRQAAAKLAVSTRTVVRLEAAGKLQPVKLSAGVAARTYYPVDQVQALARGDAS
jgi:hypothetical protein